MGQGRENLRRCSLDKSSTLTNPALVWSLVHTNRYVFFSLIWSPANSHHPASSPHHTTNTNQGEWRLASACSESQEAGQLHLLYCHSYSIRGQHITLGETFYLPSSAYMTLQMPMIGWCICDWQGRKRIPPHPSILLPWLPDCSGKIGILHGWELLPVFSQW